MEKLDELQIAKYKNVKAEELDSKYQKYITSHDFSSGLMFMGFFVGVAFLAMMASCLMFKVLSGASKDVARYQMLRKIGVRRELLTKSIYKELFFIFLFPAIVGITHILVGMNMFGSLLIDPYFRIWLPLVIFVVIYSIYYLITVQLYKGIVLPKKINVMMLFIRSIDIIDLVLLIILNGYKKFRNNRWTSTTVHKLFILDFKLKIYLLSKKGRGNDYYF